MTARLSLTMIVRDEERTIERVLGSARAVVDEMVVVDTGSTDRTVELARGLGARVVPFTWIDDFAAARNAALEAATGDWFLWLDADDVLTEDVQAGLRALKDDVLSDALDAVYLQYRYHFDHEGRCTYSFPRERLVRKAPGVRWVGPVHEVVHVPGHRLLHRDDLYVEHRPLPEKQATKPGRNLRILERAVQTGDRSSRTLYYLGRELADADRLADSVQAFVQYLDDPGVEWEQHDALVRLARCCLALSDEAACRRWATRAIALDSTRSEPFLLLGGLHFERREWERAVPWYAAATALRRPRDGFSQPADYSWRPWDYLSVCLINTGRLQEGVDATLRALSLGAPDVDRLRANLHWAVDRL